MKALRVVQYGRGSAGLGILEVVLLRPWVRLVSATGMNGTMPEKMSVNFLGIGGELASRGICSQVC